MNTYLENISVRARNRLLKIKNRFLELSKIKKAIVLILAILIITTFLRAILKNDTSETIKNLSREVTLASVSELSSKSTSIVLLGTVTSRNEAVIRAESGGGLRVVYRNLGDYVGAGQIIAEFENSAERAAVTSAEGAYESAKASKDIARINKNSSDTSLSETKTNSLNILNSTYNTLDDAVRTKTDSLFNNPHETSAEFSLAVPDQILTIKIANERIALEKMLLSRSERNKIVNQDSDLLTELTTLAAETNTVKAYLDDVSSALSKAIPNSAFSQNTIDSLKININNARTSISGTLASIAAGKSALNGSLTSLQIANTNYSDAPTGVSASADAQIKSALGNYQAALARLEKTVVRSPISGTLNSLSVKTGDYVAPYSEIGVVSNNNALEIIAYGTEEDSHQITAGAKVVVEGGFTGVVTKIAPAIDPRTKKIEIRVGLTSSAPSLVNGQSIRVNISRPNVAVQAVTSKIEIPISALKITPQGSYVFSVDKSASSTKNEGILTSHKVTEGALLGDKIQIINGLTSNMIIVTDARGLKEGKTVTIKE
jgi:multidrug efflux pump subunit AcrA (membrane-fusion protein)